MKSSSVSGKKENEEKLDANRSNSNSMPARTHTLPISALLPSPVRVRLHTTQFIDNIAATIEADRPIDGIAVARVEDKFYIVDGHARVDACRAAGLAEVVVSDEFVADDVAQVVSEHVKRNVTSPLNPLNMANAIAFLAKQGVSDPYAAIPIGEMMKRAVQLILGAYDAELRAMLQKYLMEKAAVFPHVEVPPHFFIAVYETCSSDIPSGRGERERMEEIQRRMKTLIENILGYLNMLRSQERFVFPTPDQVMAMAAALKQKKTLAAMMATPRSPPPSPSSSTAVQRTSTGPAAGGGAMLEYGAGSGDGDDHGGDIGSHLPVAATSDKKGASGVILPDSNKSIIHCLHCGKQQIVDKSTGVVCRIEEFGPVNVIRSDGDDGSNGSQVFCLSPKQVEFLGLASGTVDLDDVKQLATDRKSEVEKFLKKVSIATRFVVIAVDHEI